MKPSLAVCIPHLGSNSYGFTDSLAAMMHRLGMEGYDRMTMLSGSSSVGAYKARNGIMKNLEVAERQVGYRFDWTLWLDSDMRFPTGTAGALISHDKDIVGATYRRRSAPFEMLGKPASGSSGLARVGELYPADSLPTGVLLVRRSVYDSIPKPTWRVEIIDGNNDKGEDILFCEEARKAGYEIWLDTELTKRVRHIAETELEAQLEEAPKPQILMPNNGAGQKPLILHA